MATKMFVNLPVKDLTRSVAFFTALGYKFDPQFTDEKATCMIVGEDNYVMLLVEEFFQTFTKKKVGDARSATEVIITLSADSRQDVNELVDKALASGGTSEADPQDHGWMYGRGFCDPDGHHWEIMYMDMSAMMQQTN